jgi:hypothetical protein
VALALTVSNVVGAVMVITGLLMMAHAQLRLARAPKPEPKPPGDA